ncbi:hypothetical protein [Paracoccus sp. J39]|uniref:hypothetical protein n=1 Tax=Paracoccus sp. J39 TaxID=935848 RepID=UPI0004AE0AD0|nr:hypothetical protein [Paracoccus sp. J39]
MTSSPSDSIPHGTSRGYQYYRCRCDACRAAEIERQADWRRRLREGKVQHRSHHPSCVPVRVRGKVYPSISMAAAALGIAPTSIGHQLRQRGDADRAGLGAKAPRCWTRHNSKPVRIHGRDFPSIRAAALAMGVSEAHLRRHLSQGMTPRYSQYLLVKIMQADARAGVGGAE